MAVPMCEACDAAGVQYTLNVGKRSKTFVGEVKTFHDSDRKYHYHDSARYVQHVECSNGHKKSVHSTNACPACGDAWKAPALGVLPGGAKALPPVPDDGSSGPSAA